MVHVPGVACWGTVSSIKRACQRLINEGYVESRNRDVGTFDEPRIVTEIRFVEDRERHDREAETRAKRSKPKGVTMKRLPPTDEYDSPLEYMVAVQGDQDVPCPHCEGTGKRTQAPTKGDFTAGTGISFFQLPSKDPERVGLGTLRRTAAYFDVSLEDAARILENMIEVAKREKGEEA